MLTSTIQTTICIIGAGPAGATTSLFLAKMQIPHLVIDAAIFPRDKVCGDALDLKVIRVLNQLDPTITQEVLKDDNFSKAWGASIIINKDKKNNFHVDADNKNYPFLMVSKRAYFDNFLVSKFNKSYTDFKQGTKVKKITRQEDGWLIEAEDKTGLLRITATMIVGADGDHSAVLRSLGERKINRQHYAGALRQYWKGIADINPNNYLEIYLPKTLPLAYLWIFPLPNNEANVGCGLVSDLIAKKSIDLKKVFHQLIKEDPALSHRFRNATPLEKPVGWGLPFASEQRQVYGDGYLLTGDAASLVSPLTGEGVGPAMMSGYIAAKFIEKAVAANCFDKNMFTNYDREIYKRLQSEVKNYKLLRRISPRLYNIFINVISSLSISRWYFTKNAPKWSKTALKPIDVNLD
jgi:menaquinone-9 beta-reductase